MLQLQDVSFAYEDEAILSNIDFIITSGQLLHLQGKNGSGKTTLLKIIAGLLHLSKGQIYYAKHQIHADLLNYQRNICYVGHKSGFNAQLTVKENCFFDAHWQDERLWYQQAAILGLVELGDTCCAYLSAGQKRRVSLLRLTMTKAQLWLLDEPLVGLDQETVLLFNNLLLKHLSGGGLVIVTSHHSLNLQAPILDYWL